MNSTAIERGAAPGFDGVHGDVCNPCGGLQTRETVFLASRGLCAAHSDVLMPKTRAPPLGAPLFIQRLNVTLELRLGTYKTKPRLLVELFDEDGQRRSQVWLSDDASRRVEEVIDGLSRSHVKESDLTDEFVATLRIVDVGADAKTVAAGLFGDVDIFLDDVASVSRKSGKPQNASSPAVNCATSSCELPLGTCLFQRA